MSAMRESSISKNTGALARRRPLARLLRLSGKARAPEFFEMDDSLVAEESGAPLGR